MHVRPRRDRVISPAVEDANERKHGLVYLTDPGPMTKETRMIA
jgi:hypothetical protein